MAKKLPKVIVLPSGVEVHDKEAIRTGVITKSIFEIIDQDENNARRNNP